MMRSISSWVAPLFCTSLLALAGCGVFSPSPAWEEPPPAPREGPVVDAAALHRVQLANGMAVMVMQDGRLPRVAFGLTLRSGAGSVDPALAGVAELTTEVMQRGAGDYDAIQLARLVENVGASLSVSAGWDTTTVALNGLSGDRALLLEILETVTRRPRFEAGEFEKARSEQLAALAAAEDDPGTLIRWNTLRALYEGHRYGLPMAGNVETVSNLDLEAVRAYWSQRFVPGNAIFWAVGDVDADALIDEVRRRFGDLPEAALPSPTPPAVDPTPAQRRIVVIDKPELVQARIILAHEGIARTDETRLAADILNDVLGGSGFSSRLMQSVRADAGLTYGVSSGFALRSVAGPYSISTFTRVEEVRAVVDLLLDGMQGIRGDRPVDAEELRKSISYNTGRFGLSLETSEAVLASLVDLEVHGLPRDSLDTYRARVRAISTEDVAEAATRRLHPDRAAIVVLGPAGALVPQLEDLGAVEVWQP